MERFKSISTLRRFARKASGDFSFIWYGDKATLYAATFTFAMPHQWRKGKSGVRGSQF